MDRQARDSRGRRGGDPPSDATPLRRTIEIRSAPLLIALRSGPRWLLPVVLVCLLLAGLAAPGAVGATALIVLACVLAWLAFLSWPALGGTGRLLRVVSLLVLFALAVGRGLGWT